MTLAHNPSYESGILERRGDQLEHLFGVFSVWASSGSRGPTTSLYQGNRLLGLQLSDWNRGRRRTTTWNTMIGTS